MSFYLRKSVRLGPMRVNLSKSGLGMSVGVPGLRVGTGPRGSYVRVGAKGVYYQATTGRRGGGRSPVLAQNQGGGPLPPALGAGEVVLSDVSGAKTEALLPAEPSELVAQLNSAARSMPFWPWALVVTIGLTVLVPWLLIPLAPLTVWLAWRDQIRRTVVAFYEVDGPVQAQYQALVDGFQIARQSQRAWHVVARGDLDTTYQRKVNAGADSLVRRQSLRRGIVGPRHLRTNIEVPALQSASRSVYFLPDRLLVRDHKTYVDLPYTDLSLTVSDEQFIETGPVPTDAVQVGTTWKYVNKKGGPDRRFKDNKQLPVMRYGRLRLNNRDGLNIIWSFSDVRAPRALEAGLGGMRSRVGR